ncbi:gremlin-2-like [Hydractinia symbiolongicarpus]|uniref:gremlin-2-like n=1 Tax=Hydractinia symbiolongicarpus TaxID=13093 RepID=UPI00254D0DFE|nr:gremlin-2-like [Hydractinia symbiolongicarpus]
MNIIHVIIVLTCCFQVCQTNFTDLESFMEKLKKLIKDSIKEKPGVKVMNASEANKTWCKAVPFNHTISYTSKAGKRCTPKVVVNNMCRGRCNSFHLPGQEKSLSLHSECRASSTVEETVELHCPFSKKKRIRHIKIQKILSCDCIQCAKKH